MDGECEQPESDASYVAVYSSISCFTGSDGLKISVTKRVKNKGTVYTIRFCVSTDLEHFRLFPQVFCKQKNFNHQSVNSLHSPQMWWCWKPFSVVWVEWTESSQGSPLSLSSSPVGSRPSPPSSSSGCGLPLTATSVHSVSTLRTSLY